MTVSYDGLSGNLSKSSFSLDKVNNTSDADKPLSLAAQAALLTKAPTGATTHDGIEIFLLNDQATNDQHAALAAAFDQGAAVPGSTFYNVIASNKPVYRLPPGEFVFTQTITNVHGGAVIIGAGKGQTTLYNAIPGDAPLFMLGADHDSVGDVYSPPGSIQGVEFRDLSMVRLYDKANQPWGNSGPIGSRTGRGIQMTGGGSVILNNVSMAGFKYGNNQKCGSDFSQVTNCDFIYCDVGQYYGPGSQQINQYNVTYYACVEGLVTDRVGTLNLYGNVFNSCIESGWTDEAPGDTSTRQLTSFDPSGTSLNYRHVAIGTWFEGGAGNIAGTTPTFYIKKVIKTSDTTRGLTLIDTMVVSAPGPKQTTALVGSPDGNTYGPQQVSIHNVTNQGLITRVFHNNGPLCSITGQWIGNLPPLSNNNGTVIMTTLDDQHVSNYGPMFDTYRSEDSSRGTRIVHDIFSDRIQFQVAYNGSWLTRGSFDLGNKAWSHGDPASDPVNFSAPSMPSSTTYPIGSRCDNSAPADGSPMGWVLTATGWKALANVGASTSTGSSITPFNKRKMAFLGDSITANAVLRGQGTTIGFSAAGYLTWERRYLTEYVDIPPEMDFAVSQATIGQPHSDGQPTNNTVIDGQLQACLAAKPDIVQIHMGTNSIGSTDTATIIAQYKQVVDVLTAAGIFVICIPIRVRGAGAQWNSAAKLNQWQLVNRWVFSYAAKSSGKVIAIDVNDALTDFSTGNVKAGYYLDDLHDNAISAQVMGKYIADAIKPFFARQNSKYQFAADTYHPTDNPTGNLLPNGLFVGSGGSTGNRASGTVAATWSVGAYSGSSSNVSCLLEPDPQLTGLMNQSMYFGGTGDGGTFYLDFENFDMSKFAVGDVIQFEIEVDATGLGTTIGGITAINQVMTSGYSDLGTSVDGNYLTSYGMLPAGSQVGAFLMRTAPLTIPAGFGVIVAKVVIQVASSGSLSTNVLKFKRAAVRKLVAGYNA